MTISEESFNQRVQAQAIGAISKEEIRQFIFPNESLDEAKERVEEIAKSEPTVNNTFGM